MLISKVLIMKKDKNISILINEIRKVLINEDKRTDIIINTIGLPTEISEWLVGNFPEKFQLWFANNFKKEAVKRISGGKGVVANIMIKMLKGDRTQPSLKNQLNRQKSYFQGAFQLIFGWLQNRREIAPETDDINLKTLSFEQALQRAEVWHEAVKKLKTEQITDESGKIIKTYPDGFYWLDLQTSNCRDEAKAMGHCGQAGAGGILYSLRKNRQPVLTGEINNGVLIQLRGRANTKPKTEYHDKIMDFLLEPKVNIVSFSPSSYRADANFELKDLDINQLTILYSQKPTLFRAEDELYKVLLKYPNFATQVNFRTTPLHEEHKVHLGRLHPEMLELFRR